MLGELVQLDEHATGIGRMNKGDQRTVGSGAGRIAEEPHPGSADPLDLGFDVVHFEAQMVDARPSFRKEFCHWSVLADRLEELDPALTDGVHRDSRAGGVDILASFLDQADALWPPGLGSGIEIRDSNPYVVQSLEHGRPSSLLASDRGGFLRVRADSTANPGAYDIPRRKAEQISYQFAPAVAPRGEPALLSVVLVHYRGADDLLRCVASLQRQRHRRLEIVLVDNGSADGGADAVVAQQHAAGWQLPIRLFHVEKNRGFAAGANVGVAQARGEFIMLLNPDTDVGDEALGHLLLALENGADIAAPRLLLRDQPDQLDNCGHALFPDGLNWCRGRGEQARGRYLEAEDILLFSGAAVIFRRSALALLGALDARFFGYGEDADLALRAARLGLSCRYVPEAVIHHRVGGAFGALSLRKVFLVERNRVQVALTHLPMSWLLASPLWTLARLGLLTGEGARGRGLAASWRPWQRALLPLAVLAASSASVLAIPGSVARRRGMTRLVRNEGGLDVASWRRLLGAHRAGLRDIVRRPAGA